MEGSLVRKTCDVFVCSRSEFVGVRKMILDTFERFDFSMLEIGRVYEHVGFCLF